MFAYDDHMSSNAEVWWVMFLKWTSVNQKATICLIPINNRARCSSVVRAFAHGAMGHRIDPSGSGPIELFLISDSAPRLV